MDPNLKLAIGSYLQLHEIFILFDPKTRNEIIKLYVNFGRLHIDDYRNMQVAKYLIQYYSPLIHQGIHYCSHPIDFEIAKLYINAGASISIHLFLGSAANNNIKLLAYLRFKGKLPTKEILDWAASYGAFEVVKYLIQECQLEPDQTTLENASHGNINLIKYLLNLGIVPNRQAFDKAFGSKDILQIAELYNKYNVVFTENAMFYATQKGNFLAIKYLVDWGMGLKKTDLRNLVLDAYLEDWVEIHQYFYNQGLMLPQHLLGQLTMYESQLNALKFWISKGVQPDQNTLRDAKEYGCDVMIKYLESSNL